MYNQIKEIFNLLPLCLGREKHIEVIMEGSDFLAFKCVVEQGELCAGYWIDKISK